LVKLVQEAVQEQQQQVPGRTILLNSMPTVESVPIIADADRIRKVITTYLVDALTYSPDDQSVTVQLAVEDAVVRVSVRDEGPGISPHEQKKIWERFYHIKGREFDLNVGLYLYLCQQFIERHQGEVGLESTPGEGSTFWFTLPIARS
jgi:signal transduction histidine kinase